MSTGWRIAVAMTVFILVILAAPIGFIQFGANPPPPPNAYQRTTDAAVSLLWPLWLFEIHPTTRASPILLPIKDSG